MSDGLDRTCRHFELADATTGKCFANLLTTRWPLTHYCGQWAARLSILGSHSQIPPAAPEAKR